MALLEVDQSRQVTATIRLDEKTATLVDRYAAFIHASADDVIRHALDYVFTKDREFQEFLRSSPSNTAPSSLRVRRPAQLGSAAQTRPAATKKAEG